MSSRQEGPPAYENASSFSPNESSNAASSSDRVRGLFHLIAATNTVSFSNTLQGHSNGPQKPSRRTIYDARRYQRAHHTWHTISLPCGSQRSCPAKTHYRSPGQGYPEKTQETNRRAAGFHRTSGSSYKSYVSASRNITSSAQIP